MKQSGIEGWRILLSDATLRSYLVLTIVAALLILPVMANFLCFVESRSGAELPDPLLSLFEPVNLTWIIFGLIYLAVIITLVDLSRFPATLLLGIQSYLLLIVVRMAMMYLAPLEAPSTMIPLADPIVESFADSGQILTKDLFFSGHTSTTILLYLLARTTWVKWFCIVAAFGVGIGVIAQHVHYCVDVAAAPFFAIACYQLGLLIKRKLFRLT